MGCGGGKPNQTNQQKQPMSIVLEPRPKLDNSLTHNQQKLDYVLSDIITNYIKGKNQNYETLTKELCEQMNIQKSQLAEYYNMLQQKYTNKFWTDQHLVKIINLIKELLNNKQSQHLKHQQEWSDQDFQHQLLFIQFLVDLKHIADSFTNNNQGEIWWSQDYLKKYTDNNLNTVVLVLKQEQNIQIQEDPFSQIIRIYEAFNEYFEHQIQKIEQVIKKREQEEQEMRLQTLKTLTDDVIVKASNHDLETRINYVKQQNEKYATPI